MVGAGAAGCTLAYLLRQAGASVLVAESCDLDAKDKLCGGILGAGAPRLLAQVFGRDCLGELGLFWPERLLSRSQGCEVADRVGFATLPRARLDRWLLGRCRAAGATVRDHVRVCAIDAAAHAATLTDLHTHEDVQVSYGSLVGADGAASAVRRLLAGRRQRTIVAVERQVARSGADAVFSYHPARVGYCWYIPTDAGANAGCCLYREDGRACRTWLAAFGREEGLAAAGPLRGAPIPTGDDVLLRAAEDAWLIGDAAGLITPSVSGGIHYALASALALSAALCGGTPYEKAMAPVVGRITHEASKVADTILLTTLTIARNGTPTGTLSPGRCSTYSTARGAFEGESA